MRKYLSFFMLVTKSTIYQIFAVLLIMAASEFGLFYIHAKSTLAQLGTDQQVSLGFEAVLQRSRAVWVFAAAFLLIILVLGMLFDEKKSHMSYTLQRLQLPVWHRLALQTGYNVLILCTFMALQAILLYGMFALYRHMAPAELLSDQAFFLSCFRSNFVCAVIPMNNPLRITRNIVLVLAFSFMTVLIRELTQRKKKFSVFSFMLTMTLLWFVKEYDVFVYDLMLILTVLFVGVGGSLWQLWGGEDADAEEKV